MSYVGFSEANDVMIDFNGESPLRFAEGYRHRIEQSSGDLSIAALFLNKFQRRNSSCHLQGLPGDRPSY